MDKLVGLLVPLQHMRVLQAYVSHLISHGDRWIDLRNTLPRHRVIGCAEKFQTSSCRSKSSSSDSANREDNPMNQSQRS